MSSIRVAWQNANGAVDALSSNRTELSGYISSLRSVKNYRCVSGAGYALIYNKLGTIINQLDDEKDNIKHLENGLKDVLDEYSRYETSIFENIRAGEVLTSEIGTESGGSSGILSNIRDYLMTFGSRFGVLGNVVSVIDNLIGFDGELRDWLGLSKSIIGGIGNVVGIVGSTSPITWRSFLGLTSSAFGSGNTSAGGISAMWNNAWTTQTEALRIGGSNTVVQNVKSVTKWAGHLLTLAVNGIENYEEYWEDGRYDRFVIETAIETGTDIVAGMALTAGAAVVVGGIATAIAGAPVTVPLAVAAGIGAVAYNGINAVCEWATGGRDVGEVVTDAVYAIGETVVDGAKAIGEGIAEGISNIGNAISNTWGSFCSWVTG